MSDKKPNYLMLVVFIGLALSGMAYCVTKWGLTVVAQSTMGIFVMLAVLSALIIVHECGHFCVARFFGFQTPVFGFGLPFGPYWVLGHRWGTEFRFHACLLGGYVAIPELGDETNAKEENYGVPLQPFKKFPIWQRALVAVAGVAMNVFFAYVVILTMLTTIGDHHQSVGVGKLPPENPIAAKAGVKVNDKILSIDGRSMKSPTDVVAYLEKHPQKQVVFNMMRDSQPVDVPVTPNEKGKVGMAVEYVGEAAYVKPSGNFIELAGMAWDKMWSLTAQMVGALGMVFQGVLSGGKAATPGGPAVGIGDVHGVMAVVKFGMDVFSSDWRGLFLFTALISLDLAIINLVPWPALDGGHLAFMAVEAVRGRPMGERAQGEIVKWGFISLLVLMAVIMVNDVRALLNGELEFKMKKGKEQQNKDAPAASTSTPGTTTAAPTSPADSGAGTPAATTSSAPTTTEPAAPVTPAPAPAAEPATKP